MVEASLDRYSAGHHGSSSGQPLPVAFSSGKGSGRSAPNSSDDGYSVLHPHKTFQESEQRGIPAVRVQSYRIRFMVTLRLQQNRRFLGYPSWSSRPLPFFHPKLGPLWGRSVYRRLDRQTERLSSPVESLKLLKMRLTGMVTEPPILVG